jgi:uncharacterized protein YbjQ (UPF0145 family)
MDASNQPSLRLATTDSVAGMRTISTFEIVIGIAVRSRGVGANIMAGLDAFGNGSALDEFRDELTVIRREALDRMAAAAEELGANAVVGVRFDSADVGHDMVEVVAFGTAVMIAEI